MDHAADAEQFAAGPGTLQRLDPRIKTLGLLSLVVTAVFVKTLVALAGFLAVAAVAIGWQWLPLIGDRL